MIEMFEEGAWLYGTVESCGEGSAVVALTTGPTRTVTFDAPEVAAAMLDRVGLKVRMVCRVTWVQDSPDIKGYAVFHNKSIHVTECHEFDPIPLKEAFAELREVVGDAFDGVDVAEYMKEVRGE